MKITQIRKYSLASFVVLATAAGAAAACSSSSAASPTTDPSQQGSDSGAPGEAGPASGPAVTGYKLSTVSGGPLSVAKGDALKLVILQTLADGTTSPLPAAAKVAWSGPPVVTALPEGTEPDAGILPAPGAAPAAMWIVNPSRQPDVDYNGVLWVIDPGTAPSPTVTVTATITGAQPGGTLTETVAITAGSAGDAAAGKMTYAANCATCHGPTGHGKGDAPGLNAEDGNVASDPDWTPALLAIAARSDVDNLGVALATEMPNWLTKPASDGKMLTAADFANIYAFLKTQTK